MKKDLYLKLKNSRLFKDSFWALLGNAIGKGLSLLAGIYVAQFLGKETFGEYGMIKNTLMYIAIFSSFGLGYTATKFIAESKNEELTKKKEIHKIVTLIAFVMSGILASLLIIFAKPFAAWINAPDLALSLRFSAIAIIFNAINTTQIGELAGFNDYKVIAINSTIAGIITFSLSISLTYFYGLNGAIIALTFSLGCNCILNMLSIRKHISKEESGKICYSKKLLGKIIKFSFPIALQESLYSIVTWASMLILIKSSNYGELGILSAAAQWGAVLAFIPNSLRNVALSHLSESNNLAFQNHVVLKRLLAINFISTIIPFFIVFFLSDHISAWYGNSYIGLKEVLNVCVFTTIITSLTNVYTQELIALNHNWYLFFTRLIRDSGIVLCAYFMITTSTKAAYVMSIITLLFQVLYLIFIGWKYNFIYRKTSK